MIYLFNPIYSNVVISTYNQYKIIIEIFYIIFYDTESLKSSVFYAYCACMLRRSVTSDSATPWTEAHQDSLSMAFSQQEYWNGMSFPPPGYLPDVGISPPSPTPLALARGFFTTSATWGALCIQFSSVAQSCPTLCGPMDCSTPCLPVHRQLPEFTQTHVH